MDYKGDFTFTPDADVRRLVSERVSKHYASVADLNMYRLRERRGNTMQLYNILSRNTSHMVNTKIKKSLFNYFRYIWLFGTLFYLFTCHRICVKKEKE